jgi:hypothetical protein
LKAVTVFAIAVLVAGCAAGEPTAGGGAPVVWLVGDSISVSATTELEQAIPGVVVDAVEGRQFAAAPSVLEAMRETEPSPDVVVIALGTNGPVDPTDVADVGALTGDADLVFVNVRVPRPWESISNAEIERAADTYGATVVDWKSVADRDVDLLRSDGYHLSSSGVARWVQLITDALDA